MSGPRTIVPLAEALAVVEQEYERYSNAARDPTETQIDLAMAQVRLLANIANSLERIAEACQLIARKGAL